MHTLNSRGTRDRDYLGWGLVGFHCGSVLPETWVIIFKKWGYLNLTKAKLIATKPKHRFHNLAQNFKNM